MTIGELRRASILLGVLAEVERADAVGDSREVGRLLSGVDPAEARSLALRADFEAGARCLSRSLTCHVEAGRRTVW